MSELHLVFGYERLIYLLFPILNIRMYIAILTTNIGAGRIRGLLHITISMIIYAIYSFALI